MNMPAAGSLNLAKLRGWNAIQATTDYPGFGDGLSVVMNYNGDSESTVLQTIVHRDSFVQSTQARRVPPRSTSEPQRWLQALPRSSNRQRMTTKHETQ